MRSSSALAPVLALAIVVTATPLHLRAQQASSGKPRRRAAVAPTHGVLVSERRGHVRRDSAWSSCSATCSAVAGEEDIPPAARKALTDMKDFLPYSRTGCSMPPGFCAAAAAGRSPGCVDPTNTNTRSRSNRALRIRIALRFGSSCVTSRSPRSPRPRGRRPRDLRHEGAAVLEQEVAVAKERLEAARAKLAPQHPDIARLESELRAATQRVAEAKAAQAGEYVRQVEGEKRTREGLATSKFGDRSIMNTSFTMDLGETVVVGTSRLSGNSKALIALLTAVPPKSAR